MYLLQTYTADLSHIVYSSGTVTEPKRIAVSEPKQKS